MPTVSKIIERAAYTQLYNYLQVHNLLHMKQFGFRRIRSTSTALLQFADDILGNLENGQVTGVVYLDLKMAFDTVNHRILILINDDLKFVSKWMETNKLTLNVSKTKLMVIGGKQRLSRLNSIELSINEALIGQVDKFQYLGILINETFDWSDHIDYIHSKVAKRLGSLKRVKHLLPRESRELVFKTMIQPVLEYGDFVWGDRFNNTLMQRLQALKNKSAKVFLDKPLYSSASDTIQTLGWKSLLERRRFHRACLVFKSINNLVDFNFNEIRRSDLHHYNTR